MAFEVFNETEETIDLDVDNIISKVIESALSYEKCPYEVEVSITLMNNEGIKNLNEEYRNIGKPTDVLSFPMIDYNVPGDFSKLESMDDCFNPDTGQLMLGDIVLSVEKVKEQAIEYGHSMEREFGFLIAHSMLHLFGYDHMEDEERIIMEQKQEDILKNIGITR